MRRTLWVDDRLKGKHGIGRFAAETVGRMQMPHRILPVGGSPRVAADVLRRGRVRLPAHDVVFTPSFNAGLTRARQVLTLHDLIHLQVEDERSAAKTLFYEKVVKPAVRRAGLVVTVSGTSAGLLQEWIGDDGVDVADVGNGCSEVFFRRHPPAREPDRLRMLSVGSLKPHKAPELPFDLLRRLPDAQLTIVTNETVTVRRLAAERGVADRVRVLADCSDDELVRLYATHSCLVFPSRIEGFGLPVVEAVAMGCPVVYRGDCASVAEIVAPLGTAVDGDDLGTWAEAVQQSASSPRPEAPADWADRYSWDAVGARLDSVLSGVMAA